MTDDQGWFDAGFNGNTKVRTPQLDQLAAKGIVLKRFYSASAVCSPTRASVLTGRNPLRMHIPHANTGHMLPEEITLPEILQKHGYTTGHFGKWHLGTLSKYVKDANRGGRPEALAHYSIPTEHGYDTFFCTESKVPTYDPMRFPEQFEEGESKRYGWKAIEHGEASENYGTAYWTDENRQAEHNLEGDDSRVIMDRVIPFVESAVSDGQPFFTTIWFHTPHLPVVADSIHRSLYANSTLDKQLYYGAIAAMDEQVGRLVAELKNLDADRNTMIWFCSDNGPERDTPGSAGIFRERKRSLYAGGVRVPAFVVWPDQLEAGISMDIPAVTSDYLPTILDALRIDYPSNRPIDGKSILEMLLGKEQKRDRPVGFIFQEKYSWVNDSYKLISVDDRQHFELYNLLEDPGETRNIIEKEPAVAEGMKKELESWLTSVEGSRKGDDY
jgi:arylsulfatase A-like enzyme